MVQTQVSVGVLLVCLRLLLQPPEFVLSLSGHLVMFTSQFKEAGAPLEADTTE